VADLSKHEAHELPLANRLVNKLIREWLDINTNIALAGSPASEYERGVQEGARQMRNLHLASFRHQLTPQILDELQRAGLLVSDTGPAGDAS
jgi:hypothetical protein